MMMQEVSSNDHVDGVNPVQEPSEEQVIEYRGRCCTIIQTLDRATGLCFQRGTKAHYVSTRVFRTVAIVTMIFTAMVAIYFSSLGIGYGMVRHDKPEAVYLLAPLIGAAIEFGVLGLAFICGYIAYVIFFCFNIDREKYLQQNVVDMV